MTKIYTHSEKFHVDEIFAINLLARFWFEKAVCELNIVRTRDRELLSSKLLTSSDFVIDVGREYNPELLNFDHHQKDLKESWIDETPLSSCGLIYHYLKKEKKFEYLNEEVLLSLEELVKKIDLCDNGIKLWEETDYFMSFNRDVNNNIIQDKQFKKALLSAEYYLDNFLYNQEKSLSSKLAIEYSIKESVSNFHEEIVFFDVDIDSARLYLVETKALWMAVQNDKNTWLLQNIPINKNEVYSSKMKMPKIWCGLEEEELKKISGFNIKFCHKQGFVLLLSGTKEEVINCVNKMINLEPLE